MQIMEGSKVSSGWVVMDQVSGGGGAGREGELIHQVKCSLPPPPPPPPLPPHVVLNYKDPRLLSCSWRSCRIGSTPGRSGNPAWRIALLLERSAIQLIKYSNEFIDQFVGLTAAEVVAAAIFIWNNQRWIVSRVGVDPIQLDDFGLDWTGLHWDCRLHWIGLDRSWDDWINWIAMSQKWKISWIRADLIGWGSVWLRNGSGMDGSWNESGSAPVWLASTGLDELVGDERLIGSENRPGFRWATRSLQFCTGTERRSSSSFPWSRGIALKLAAHSILANAAPISSVSPFSASPLPLSL